MMMIESMDKDTETRRLSPVAIVSSNKYIDLINGPQDHGWCFGYTCQKRVSTFMSIVANGLGFDIYLSSTPPNQLRFRILNADPSFKITISVYYFTSNRIDVYKNDRFVLPTNGYYENGFMKFNDTSANLTSFMPTVNSPSGTNLAVRSHRRVYATIGGSDYIDFIIAAAVVLKFGAAGITPEQFYNPKTVVQNLCDLLQMDCKLVRQVNIVRQPSRKRQLETTFFELIIFDNPSSNTSNAAAANNASLTNLAELTANASTLFTTGQLQQLAASRLNLSLVSLGVTNVSSTSPVTIKQIDKLRVIQEASYCREQSPCSVQPKLVVLDNMVT
jgi:hypothetical protein